MTRFRWILVITAATFTAAIAILLHSTLMPGKSYSGTLPPLTSEQQQIAMGLRTHVQQLAGVIGERNTERPEALEAAAKYIEGQMQSFGYKTQRQSFHAAGEEVSNIDAEIPGTSMPLEIVIVGAHYDSVPGTPGANDNGSGVAAVLELARMFRGKALDRTVRFVFFVNEEPPFFQGEEMGSLVYAKGCRERKENIVAMYSLETIGYYSDKSGSQHYPSGMGAAYPDRGNFISFVANESSAGVLRDSVKAFRNSVKFPSVGAALPESIPGAGWSDHWSFWKQGYPGVMLTDTAPYRYPHYHLASDTPEKVNYNGIGRIVSGVAGILKTVTAAQ